MISAFIRRAVPWLVFPLAVIANALAAAPWLRAFPAATMAVPLFGAALLSVVIPLVTCRLIGRLWVGLLIDGLAFIVFTQTLVLKEPLGFGDLWDGLWHGPARVLTFALPLVNPPTLLVAPIALCWLAGTVAGESLGRGRAAMLPYVGWLLAFAVSYAATQRSVGGDLEATRWVDISLGGALLVTLALLRVSQAWARRAAGGRDGTEGEGVLPLRPVAVGLATTVVVALVATLAVQAGVFGGQPAAAQREPAVNRTEPVTPTAFVAGLRPASGSTDDPELFSITTDQPSNGYISLASVDFYDGDSWAFTRSFRPSGGVMPAELDPALTPNPPKITQDYQVLNGKLLAAPWMPYLSRPDTVEGIDINVDADSGMIVPSAPVSDGASYSVTSASEPRNLAQLPDTSMVAGGAAPIDTQLPVAIRPTLVKVVDALETETGVASTDQMRFLQAVARDFKDNYGLAGVPPSSGPGQAAPSTALVPATGVEADKQRSGGTNFSDVVASLIGAGRTGTPEQFATLYALVARQIGVPARVVAGFKVPAKGGETDVVTPGDYSVKASQATSWVEVPVRGAGWVAVDSTPTKYLNRDDRPIAGAASPSPSPSAGPTQNAQLQNNDGGHAVAKHSDVPQPKHESYGGVVLIVALALFVLVLLVMLALWLRKWRRRRRRERRPDPRARVIGAWSESLDMLAESGLPDLAHLTGSEIALATSLRYGEESGVRAATLAQSANVAIYSRNSLIDDELADEAWATERSLQKSVRGQLPIAGRAAAALRHSSVSATRRGPLGPESWAAAAVPARPRRRWFAWGKPKEYEVRRRKH